MGFPKARIEARKRRASSGHAFLGGIGPSQLGADLPPPLCYVGSIEVRHVAQPKIQFDRRQAMVLSSNSDVLVLRCDQSPRRRGAHDHTQSFRLMGRDGRHPPQFTSERKHAVPRVVKCTRRGYCVASCEVDREKEPVREKAGEVCLAQLVEIDSGLDRLGRILNRPPRCLITWLITSESVPLREPNLGRVRQARPRPEQKQGALYLSRHEMTRFLILAHGTAASPAYAAAAIRRSRELDKVPRREIVSVRNGRRQLGLVPATVRALRRQDVCRSALDSSHVRDYPWGGHFAPFIGGRRYVSSFRRPQLTLRPMTREVRFRSYTQCRLPVLGRELPVEIGRPSVLIT